MRENIEHINITGSYDFLKKNKVLPVPLKNLAITLLHYKLLYLKYVMC